MEERVEPNWGLIEAFFANLSNRLFSRLNRLLSSAANSLGLRLLVSNCGEIGESGEVGERGEGKVSKVVVGSIWSSVWGIWVGCGNCEGMVVCGEICECGEVWGIWDEIC